MESVEAAYSAIGSTRHFFVPSHFFSPNSMHPFREGNGRTQLAFVGMMADTFGQPLHLERVRESTVLRAMIASSLAILSR
jgi:fido (protein-threonine AMPylation protein)